MPKNSHEKFVKFLMNLRREKSEVATIFFVVLLFHDEKFEFAFERYRERVKSFARI